jgi:hypothetical protein
MAEQQIVMKVPEEMIKAQVQSAVVQALSKDPEALIASVVGYALAQKANSYDRETILDRLLREMIHAEVKAAFALWIEEQRPAIRAQMVTALGKRKEAQVKTMADRILDSLAAAEIHVSLGRSE